MELDKRANGTSYQFGSEQFINEIVNICKYAEYTDIEIYNSLESLENEYILIHNKRFSSEN